MKLRFSKERRRIFNRITAMLLSVLMIVQAPLPYLYTSAYASEDTVPAPEIPEPAPAAEPEPAPAAEPIPEPAAEQTQAPEDIPADLSESDPAAAVPAADITQTAEEPVQSEVLSEEAGMEPVAIGSDALQENLPAGEILSSEGTESENTEPGLTETENTEQETAETEPEKHTAADITANMDQLKLNLGNAWYINAAGERTALPELTGGVDYSSISEAAGKTEHSLLTAGLSVLYRLRQDGGARTVRGTDWFIVYLPDWMNNIRMTEGGGGRPDCP